MNKLESKAMALRNVEHIEDLKGVLQNATSDLVVPYFGHFWNTSKQFHPKCSTHTIDNVGKEWYLSLM
jgi:hypothetical protein